MFLLLAIAVLAGPQTGLGQVTKGPQPRPAQPASRPDVLELQTAVTAYVKGDTETAVRLWRSLAERGNVFAQAWFAKMVVANHEDEGIKWYLAAASQGDSFAMRALSRQYLRRGQREEADKWDNAAKAPASAKAKHDYEVAAGTFLKTAEQAANVVAQRLVGEFYSSGKGLPKDDSQALKWWRLAANGGDLESFEIIGSAYLNGSGVKPDIQEAERWYRKAYAAGAAIPGYSPSATLGIYLAEIARSYESGHGAPLDLARAEKYYLEVGELRGDWSSACFFYGEQGQKDLPKALDWYKKTEGRRGSICGFDQARVASAYAKGEGLSMDPVAAARWYKDAARNGNAQAMRELGKMYELGRGADRDLVQAYAWLDLSAVTEERTLAAKKSVDETSTQFALSSSKDGRDRLAASMSNQQITEAQRLSAQWARDAYPVKDSTPGNERPTTSPALVPGLWKEFTEEALRDALRQVLRSSDSGFASLQGEHLLPFVAPDGAREIGEKYRATLQLPGAKSCEVERPSERFSIYSCAMLPAPNRESLMQQFSKVRDVLQSVIGGTSQPVTLPPGTPNPNSAAEFQLVDGSSEALVTVTARAARNLPLQVSLTVIYDAVNEKRQRPKLLWFEGRYSEAIRLLLSLVSPDDGVLQEWAKFFRTRTRTQVENIQNCSDPNLCDFIKATADFEVGSPDKASNAMDLAFEKFARLAAAAQKTFPDQEWFLYLLRGKIRHALGNTLGSLSDLHVALDVCKRVVACAGSSNGEGDIHTVLSLVLFDQGKPLEAAAECQAAEGFGLHHLQSTCAFMRRSIPKGAEQAAPPTAVAIASDESTAIDRIRGGRFAPLPRAQQGAPTTQGGGVELTLANNTSYRVVLYLSGPTNRTVSLDPNSSMKLTLGSGPYRIGAEIPEAAVMPLYGEQTLEAGNSYRETFGLR